MNSETREVILDIEKPFTDHTRYGAAKNTKNREF